MRKRQWMKRGLCLGLAFSLTAGTVTMADVAIPPTATGVPAQTQQQNYPGAAAGAAGDASQGPGAGTGQNGAPGQDSAAGQVPGSTDGQGQPGGSNQTQAGGSNQTQAGGSNQTQAGNSGQIQTGSSSPSRLPSVTATVTTQAAQSGSQSGSLEKPVVQSQGAVLYDATHNQFLFEQNADTRFYPASITKLMTALLVLESCNLEDTVTFSQSAVSNLESGAVSLKVQAGDRFSVKDCLYGLLLKSANEIANGLAEHVAGSVSAFADRMNQKAASLGCTNTHFVNPNGLNNSEHYTTARDMALIAKAAFENPTLCQIASTVHYNFPATVSVPTVRQLTMGHKMVDSSNANYYYPGIVGGKTGYTSLAGNTLVTCAERDGVRLVAVVLKSRQTHYQDTKSLLDYGFEAAKAQVNTQTPGGPSSPGAQSAAGSNRWAQEQNGWRFVKSDGTYAKNEQLIINGELYCFNGDQYMVNGWYQIDGIWYFFRPSGGLAKSRWVETSGKWYYVDGNGSLFTGGVTPDGFTVDGNGVWVE